MDGLILFEKDGKVYFASQHGGVVEVNDALMAYSR